MSGCCTVCRQRTKNAKPLETVTLSQPFYPENYKNRTELRNAVHDFMTQTVEKEGSYAYYTYIKKEKNIENNSSM